MKYEIIYADPAWEYNTKECLAKTSILNGELNTHYSTMTLKELKTLDVQSISDKNCMLFLWVVSPMLKEGIEVMEAWGFKYATIAFIWHKQRTNPGHYTMSECEICLVGKRGTIPTPRGARNVRQFLSEMRGKHSAKPNEIRTRIETMFPTQKPVLLLEYLIRTYTNENELVLDNTAGSGTTAIACLKTNRQFIVMEKEQKYYDIILKRVADFNKNFEPQTLFGNEM